MPVPTCSVYSPFSRCGMPQANSTTSRPRCTSPSASDSTLPCSSVMIAEISRRSRSSNSFSLNITRARRSGGVAAQAGKAAAAAATAASTSARLARATWAMTSPAAGFERRRTCRWCRRWFAADEVSDLAHGSILRGRVGGGLRPKHAGRVEGVDRQTQAGKFNTVRVNNWPVSDIRHRLRHKAGLSATNGTGQEIGIWWNTRSAPPAHGARARFFYL